MQRNAGSLRFGFRAATVLVAVTASASTALAAPPRPQPSRAPVGAIGTLVQLDGTAGCVADRSAHRRGCTPGRAVRGPGPFLGSNAIAVSPDGRNVYVAASDSDAITVFARDARSGRLTQRAGRAGCIATRGASGCAAARGLDGPNSLAISPDGAHVYATSLESDAVTVLRRDRSSGALRQLPGAAGCIGGGVPVPGCATGRGIAGPDVVTVSPDGANVYVGSFVGNALAVFARDSSSGRLTQPADASGCLVAAPADGCTTVLALLAPEGMAISGDGDDVYVAAALGNALLVLTRDSAGGALTQATDGSGCIVDSPLAGCTTGVQLAGANAVAVSPDDGDVYVTSLTSNSLTSFTRAAGSGTLTQQSGTSACAIYALAVGCSLARVLREPEGLAVAPDGATIYAAAFGSGALDLFDRAGSGALMQKPRRAGCMASAATPNCRLARALQGVSSIALSPNGRFLYATAFRSDAVAAFERIGGGARRGAQRRLCGTSCRTRPHR